MSASQTPPPTAKGTLAKTPFPHLLVYTFERRLTGTIDLRDPGGQSVLVFVREGQPTKIRTSEPAWYLGAMLAELGFVTEPRLGESLARMAAEQRLHGEILVE